MEVLTNQFEELRKAIEPSEPRKKDAKKADDPVREHLEAHQSFAEHHITTFLYGSYKRRTAICDIKDVDLVVVTNYTTDDKPLDVLSDLKDSLAEDTCSRASRPPPHAGRKDSDQDSWAHFDRWRRSDSSPLPA